VLFCLLFTCSPLVTAQDLAPRAYVITPLNTNAIVLTYSHFNGSLEFDGAVPISGAKSNVNMPIFNCYHTLNFFGRTANVAFAIPYGVGDLHGTVFDAPKYAYRSGLLDSYVRFAVNLKGGPSMGPQDFPKWRQTVLLGASLKISAPTGQYDPTRLLNWGNNRWAFKGEFGYSQRFRKWVLDGYAAGWFFTSNPEFFSYNRYFPGAQIQTQQPIAAFETHLSYDVRPRLWFSLDGNFWFGGKTSLNGLENPATQQKSSRVGATASIPLTNHQSVKFSYSRGAYVSYGGNYQNVSVAWQYAWIGWPRFFQE
jgi:hypothetical protein